MGKNSALQSWMAELKDTSVNFLQLHKCFAKNGVWIDFPLTISDDPFLNIMMQPGQQQPKQSFGQ